MGVNESYEFKQYSKAHIFPISVVSSLEADKVMLSEKSVQASVSFSS